MMEVAQTRPWSDLPPELLGLVLKRLPSLPDRVLLRAVCHPWRSNSWLQSLPLPFPWLTLPDGIFIITPDGEIHRIRVPYGACCHGSLDNWLFLKHIDNGCSLMNPFTKTILELPNLVEVWQCELPNYYSDPKHLLYKLVVPSSLESSPNPIVVALITENISSSALCIIQPPTVIYSSGSNRHPLRDLADVAFFDGLLYAVSKLGKLSIIENLGSSPNIRRVIDFFGVFRGVPQYFTQKGRHILGVYLVECGDKLLIVKRVIRFRNPISREDFAVNIQTVGFDVLEADLHSSPSRWRRVGDLGGHAIFVSRHCSKSLLAREYDGCQEDCIYFIPDYPRPKFCPNPLRNSGVYNMRTGTITPLMSGTTAAALRRVGHWRPTWLFHPKAV